MQNLWKDIALSHNTFYYNWNLVLASDGEKGITYRALCTLQRLQILESCSFHPLLINLISYRIVCYVI